MKTILVIGGTGAMGRPVVAEILQDKRENWAVRVLTRNPKSSHAKALKATAPDHIELIQGDVKDIDSLKRAMEGVYGVFCNTNFWSEASVIAEYESGLRCLEAAKSVNVDHFIYSSLDSAANLSDGNIYCGHFDAKAAVQHYIDMRRSDDYMRSEQQNFDGDAWFLKHVSVLVTAPYIENFRQFAVPEKGILSDGREGVMWNLPMGEAGQWPMIALADLAGFVADMFADPDTWQGRTLRGLSQSLSFDQIAEIFERTTGIPAEYQPMTLSDYEALDLPNVHDVIGMFEFFRSQQMPRDLSQLATLRRVTTFEDWLRGSNWRGTPSEVQKDAIMGECK